MADNMPEITAVDPRLTLEGVRLVALAHAEAANPTSISGRRRRGVPTTWLFGNWLSPRAQLAPAVGSARRRRPLSKNDYASNFVTISP